MNGLRMIMKLCLERHTRRNNLPSTINTKTPIHQPRDINKLTVTVVVIIILFYRRHGAIFYGNIMQFERTMFKTRV